ncbi:ATP-binding protein [Streptomyces sp. NPDC057417]|uniref:sensor histidine kinase n=1 Tax=Streptomyces sp. NPDC057417 TaxID=3346125 RepID=UPI0036C99181
MSQLRAPAPRADRREGGRHGRPASRTAPGLPETHIRSQLLRIAVLPPVAVALSGCAAVLFTVRSTGARPGLTLWAVLAGALSVTLVGIGVAAVAAGRAARSVHDRVGVLRRATARREADLRALVEALRRGDGPPQPSAQGRGGGPGGDADDFDLLTADLSRAHDGAVTAVVQASQLSSQAGSEQKLEVFVNLARRLQSLVHREISLLDELENEMEDPDLLKGLFHVDHLATRIRRHAENLAVLGGAVSRRQWSNPVDMTEVLRSAIAEVEQYSRVKLVPPIDGQLRGHAVADVIHLLAELVENATVFSAPHTQVLLRANLVTSGLAVEVEDRGLGMPVEEQTRMNALLADPDQVNVARLLADGRIGLFVVSQLARRHGITVRLQSNIYGGVQAVLVVPQALLGTEAGAPGGAEPQGGAVAGGRTVPLPQTGGPGQDGLGPQQERQQERHGLNGQSGPQERSGLDRTHGQAPAGAGAGAGSSDGFGSGDGFGGGGAAGGSGQHAAGRDADPGGRRVAAPAGPPAPLPVRGARRERPTPADAAPGIKPEDRPALAEHGSAPPTPRNGAVRGTMGKPQLPRRRAQEHIAPQLRDGPVPRQDTEFVVGHDPGLMAAFQRGISLAETQQSLEAGDMAWGDTVPAHMESAYTTPPHLAPVHREPAYTEPSPLDPAHMEPTHMEPTHVAPAYMEPTHRDPGHVVPSATGPAPMALTPMGSAPTGSAPTGPAPTGPAPRDPAPMDPAPTDPPHQDTAPRRLSPLRPVRPEALAPEASPAVPAPGLRPEHRTTDRRDGSAPAG